MSRRAGDGSRRRRGVAAGRDVFTAATPAGTLHALLFSPWWWIAVAVRGAPTLVGAYNLVQRRHTVQRNYPIFGHPRYERQSLRPEPQQYFAERHFDGLPFDRDTRTIVHERAKGIDAEEPFGSERDIYERG